MNEMVLKYLEDIHRSIEFIEQDIEGKRFFNEYQTNRPLRQLVERNLEIIGEAVNKILKLDASIAISSAMRIVGLRNRLIHAYDAIDDASVWNIVINHLPTLKIEVEKLLEK